MSKSKQQGTAFETWTRKALNALNLHAARLAEGGSYDEGDVETELNNERWIIECKATSSLNVQKILGKARRKAKGQPVILVWKRLVRVNGKSVRQPVEGERIVVCLGWDDFVRLLTNAAPSGEMVDNSTEDNYE